MTSLRCRECQTAPVKPFAPGDRRQPRPYRTTADGRVWRDFCSRQCGCRSARRQQSPAIVQQNLAALQAGNRERSKQSMLAALHQVFGDRLTQSDQPLRMDEAIRLAVRFGRARWYAGYKAGYGRQLSARDLRGIAR